MNVKFLSSSEKKKFIQQLNEQYGITNLPYLLFYTGKEKIRAYSGSLTKEEILKIGENVNIEIIGIYLATIEKDGIRLSFDTPNLLKEQINKNIVEINKKQAEEWLRGYDIEINEEGSRFVILKHNSDFLGCGKLSNNRIANFVPKERRVR